MNTLVNGSKIRELRESESFSQDELAERVFLNRSAIAQFENNIREPNASTLQRIADVFGVSMDSLMKSEGSA